jgi:hypothetical protein
MQTVATSTWAGPSDHNSPALVRFSAGRVFWVLLLVIAALVFAHLALHACYRVDVCAPLRPVARDLGYIFDLSVESNLPTWFSVIQLALSALALALVALVQRASDGDARRWWMLSLLFVYLSLDEATDLHGLWIRLVPNQSLLSERSGFDWVIPGVLIVLAVGAYFLPWLWRLPPRTRGLFVLAGALYVTGGLGLEAVGAFVADETWRNPAYVLTSTAEEALEMLGVLVILYATLAHLANRPIALDVTR